MTPEAVLQEIGEDPVARVLAVAAADPHAIAVDDGARRLEYGELAARMGRIAATLRRELGDRPDPVVLLLEHDARAPLGLLGILAAGKVPIPLDAELPSTRHATILARSGAAAVLHSDATRATAHTLAQGRSAFDIDAISHPGVLAAPPTIDPDAPAYVLHTSGSTGVPRGVWQDRRGLMRDVAGFLSAASLSSSDRLSGVYSFAVNGALRDIYASLSIGARLEMRSLRREGVEALRSILKGGLTICHCVPPVLRALRRLAESEGDRYDALRLLYIAGDRLDAADLVGIQRIAPNARVLTGLGSTEIATMAFEWILDPATLGEADLSRPLPVGRPVPGRRIRLLSENGEAVPDEAVGVVGELEVESDHLARGIWNDPIATSQAFRIAEDGRRVFRSGDQLSRLADGRFVHHGRADSQVKIDGHRVEAAETEATLRAQPIVRDAAVLVRRHATGRSELEAHVVVEDAEAGSSSDRIAALAAALRADLPAAFVPTRWRLHEALPSGPNLKIDRASLERMGCGESDSPNPPQDELERTIASAWARCTATPIEIGRSTRWRQCSGDSMHAVAAAIELTRRTGRSVRGGDLAVDPTVAELAAVLRDRSARSEPARGRPGGVFELLPTQAMLWRLRGRRGPAAASVTWAIEFEGDLDPVRFAAAWRQVVECHDGLRLRIVDEGGRLLGCGDGPGPEWIETTCSRDEAIERLRTLAAMPADLQSGRTGHVLLARVGGASERRWILGVHLDHVGSDLAGRAALLEDLSTVYAGGTIEAPCPIGEACRRIAADFDASHSRVVAAWRERLRSWPDLPQGVASGIRSTCVVGEQVESIFADAAGISKRLAATSFSVELAAIAAAVFAETGAESLAIGVPISLRDDEALTRPFGCLIATIPVLLQPGRWRSLAEGVREADRSLDRLRHDRRQSPAAIAEAWRAEGRTSPLWTTLVSRDHAAAPLPKLPGVAARSVPLPESSDVAPLSIVLTPGSRPMVRIGTDLAAIDPTRLLERIGTVLARGARDPEGRMTVVSASEESAIRSAGSPSEAQPARTLLPTLLEALAADPQRTVLIDESMQTWSARSLLTASAAVAEQLAAAGVGVGVPVALRVGRTAAVLPALLGAWMRGAIVVPIEPRLPPRRVHRLCEIASVGFALHDDAAVSTVDGTRAAWLPAGIGELRLASFATLAHSLATPPSQSAALDQSPDGEAVLLFTSGSTGEPKGVPILASGLANFLESFKTALGLGSETRSAWLSALGFDVSLSELLLGLWSGGSVAIPAVSAGEDPPGMLPWADRAGATLLCAVPSVWRLALPVRSHKCRAISVISTGEPIEPALAGRLAESFEVAWNGYGPTETNFCSLERLDPSVLAVANAPDASTVSIGRPLPGMTMRVLSTGGTPLPPGIPGEIAIGGVSCMQGYRRAGAVPGRETLVSDPLAEVDRLHRSGDRGVLLPDGRFECLGRLDGQVKVSGVRAELGEVEAVLRSVVGVHDAAAVMVPRQERIAVFVVAMPGAAVDAGDLRTACEASLHPSAVPQRVVIRETLPRTPHGKIDRRSLADEAAAELAAHHGGHGGPFDGQSDDVDLAKIARCMGEVVGRGPLGPDDDFFSVGGDSLSSIRLSIELEQWFRRPVFPVDLLEGRTPRALAKVMQNRLDREAETPVLELRAGRPGLEQEAPLALVPGLGGSPLSFVTLVRLLGGGRRVLGATLPEARPIEDEEASIESIARRIVDALPDVPCVHFIGYSMGARIAFEAARQVIAQGRRATLIVLDTMALVDGAGPRRWARTAWRAARTRLRSVIDPSRDGEAAAEPEGGTRARIRRSATLVRAAAERHSYERTAIPMALLVSTSTTGRRWSEADGGWSRVANLLLQEAIPGDHLSIVAGDEIGTTAQAIDRAITMLERASQASLPADA